MTKLIHILAIALMSIALLACGEQNGDARTDAAGETQTNGDTGDSVDSMADTGNDENNQPDQDTDEPAGDYPQATVDGTMTLFIDYLAQGQYQAATDVTDPTSIEVQEAFAQRIENFTYPHPNPNVEEAQIEFLRDLFSQPYRDAEWTVNSVDKDAGEATVTLTLFDGRSRDMTLVWMDEAWWVFPREGFLDWAEQSVGQIMQEQQGTAPTQPGGQQPDEGDQTDG